MKVRLLFFLSFLLLLGGSLHVQAQEEDAPVAGSDVPARAGEFSRTECHEEAAALLEKPAISDLQAVAGAFNDAFNSALYELELSRRTIQERSSRISELDEAIQSVSAHPTVPPLPPSTDPESEPRSLHRLPGSQ